MKNNFISEKDKRYILTKMMVNLFLIIAGTAIMVMVLRNVHYRSVNTYQLRESQNDLARAVETIENNINEAERLTGIYHQNNSETIRDIHELFVSGLYDGLGEYTTFQRCDIMEELAEKSGVEYLYLIDEKGTIMMCPKSDYTGLNLIENNLMSEENLRSLLNSDGGYIEEKNSYGNYYFYSSKIETPDANYYLIAGQDSVILDVQFSALKDISIPLKNTTVTNGGFLFAINSDDNSFIFFEDGEKVLTGKNALEYCDEKILEDGFSGKENIDGVNYYCVTQKCSDFVIVAAAVDTEALYSGNSQAIFWSTATFVCVSLICLVYAFILRGDIERNRKKIDKKYFFKGKLSHIYFDNTIARKMAPLIVASIIAVFGVTYYIQTIMELSNAVARSSDILTEIEKRSEENQIIKNEITNYYESQFLSKNKLIAYLLEEDPSVLNEDRDMVYHEYIDNKRYEILDDEGNALKAVKESKGLQRYCEENSIDSIYIYDEAGHVIATNTPNWYVSLSFDENDQTTPFREVLDSHVNYLIQEARTNDIGDYSQYTGVTFNYYTTTNSIGETEYVSKYVYQDYLDGVYKGNKVTKHTSLIQLGLDTSLMDSIVNSTDIQYVISQRENKDLRIALFDGSTDHRILYSFNENYIGLTAKEAEFSDRAFSGYYNGFQKINGKDYFTCIRYYNGNYIGALTPKTSMYLERLSISLTTEALGLVFIIMMLNLITFSSDEEERIDEEIMKVIPERRDHSIFPILMPSGRESMTKKAEARWDNRNIPWHEKTPEQKLATILFYTFGIAVIVVFALLTLVKKSTNENSVVLYIINGMWDRSFNIFAVTACVLVMLTTALSVKILSIPVNLITSIFGTKTETVGHLLLSVIKYVGTLGAVFFCLYMVGFDSSSLLASAGIMSLVIGLGSQNLIKDVIAGVFIVFEGEFRVGDIVSIGGYRGQVLDIGLRTTKIMSDDRNIKIIKNNDISGVINMTRALSIFSIDMTVNFGESIERIEEILKCELPAMKESVPEIAEGPIYKGIAKFDQRTITFTVESACKERDIVKARTELNKQLIEMFYRNGINVTTK